MPPRHQVVVIVLFWLATSGWLFQREFWPSLRPGEPPPYTIDLVDEARQVPITWTLYRGKKEEKKGLAHTAVEYHPEDDTFDLKDDLNYPEPYPSVVRLTSRSLYHVTRDGELRAVQARLTLVLQPFKVPYEIRGEIEGPVRNGRFFPQGSLTFPGGEQRVQMEPVSVAGRGNVLLNPTHALNRIRGIRPGQHWRAHLFDPMSILIAQAARSDPVAQALAAPLAGSDPSGPGFRVLEADVLRQPEALDWDGRREKCLVIEYRGKDELTRVWVREDDGLVLQQEATFLADRLVLKRNP